MARRNVTLKQISQEAGVSTTTVHRVLNGKEGCGEELKARILAIAEEQGYSVNVNASTLRKKTIQIAFVFPSNNAFSRFFMGNILNGYQQAQETLDLCNVQFHEFFYDYDDPDSMVPILRSICMDDPVHIDGIALWGITSSQKVIGMLNRVRGKGIPLVMIERAPTDPELYDCCVGPDDQLVGAMAGEMLCKLVRRSGKVLIIDQMLGNPDPSSAACVQMLQQLGRTDLEPLLLTLPMQNTILMEPVRNILLKNPDIVALYATSARHTLASIQAIHAVNYSLESAIGSELFTESREALNNGILSAVINKCPHTIGRQALQLLLDRVVKNEVLPKQYQVMPLLVLQANQNVCQKY